MTSEAFVSYAQNAEDVVLWRALRDVASGTYVEVGANHPTVDSVSRAFYDRGWSGLCVEPLPSFAEEFRRSRPRDTVVQAAVLDTEDDTVVLHAIEGTGLSTTVEDIGSDHGGGPAFDPVVKFMNAYRAKPRRVAERMYITCGVYEPLIVPNRSMVPVFESTGAQVRYVESRDGHSWENWRDRLGDGLSWIFPGPQKLVYE